jgi:hypothetical protein
MTEAQKITVKQIIKVYKDLFYEKPIIVDMGDRKIIVKKDSPIMHGIRNHTNDFSAMLIRSEIKSPFGDLQRIINIFEMKESF